MQSSTSQTELLNPLTGAWRDRFFNVVRNFVFIVVAINSHQAAACSACGFGEDPSRIAYILTTGLMTAVPLLAVGILVMWLKYKMQDADNIDDGHSSPDEKA
jgi:hypothetical protein